MKYAIFALLLASGVFSAAGGEFHDRESCRRKLIDSPEAAQQLLAGGDRSDDPVLRRTAFRTLLRGDKAKDVLTSALADKDPVIRRFAVYEMFAHHESEAFPVLKDMAADPDPQVADMVLQCAKNWKNNEESRELLTLLMKSRVREVSRAATNIIDFPYYREVKLLRNDPTYDKEVVTLKTIPLPQEGWRFRCDPRADAHHKGWMRPDFDDGKWKQLKIGAWEEQGYPGYDGIAWYRLHFRMPPESEYKAVEIHFGAVDETAWVWLNGKYAGQHDVGPLGWDKPFELDITQEILWDAESVLTVRVEDTVSAGGIWKPVTIHLVK